MPYKPRLPGPILCASCIWMRPSGTLRFTPKGMPLEYKYNRSLSEGLLILKFCDATDAIILLSHL